ncbi:MAG: undecaprenyl/decaprenyl-phosphate alpha-N-acetylglucosaminyl 1-phosphate transferase [Promicromonosporaceae bacterium]|nr:undecaprenyl/decaprenyl-phosphate alpha-N-acetylglucosaminyl 1-phosphate transferase [Promicromonosporaceae bacterium]
MRVYVLLMLIAAAVTYLTTPAARWVARKTHAVSAVRERDVHVTPTPRLGGLAILAGIAAAMLIAWNTQFLGNIFASPQPWGVLGGAVLVAILGWADDVWDLDWMMKLAGQILAAGFMAMMQVQLTTWPIPGMVTIPGSTLSLATTILIVVASMNAINFVDGLDGLAAGIIAIGSVAFFLYTYDVTQQTSPADFSSLALLLLSALVGACLGFLPHNFFPSHIFMGDSGSMVLGLVLAGATISMTGHVTPAITSGVQGLPAFVPLLLPIIIVTLPVVDMSMAVIRRLSRGQSPFQPDRNHLHHRMLALGHSHRRAVLILYIWTAVIAFAGVSLVWWPWRNVLIVSSVVGLITIAITLGPLRTRGRILDDDVATGQIPVVEPVMPRSSPWQDITDKAVR